jgi:ubiquitin C-terminal hydrolase
MNATIQCLAHIPELSEELIKIYLNNKNNNYNFSDYIKNNQLTIEYTLLLINIFFPKNNQKFFAPYNLKKIIGSQDSLFNGSQAEDAKDLLIFLIETMNT